jgi:transcriptional regulator with XRE-family HTH domain
MRYAIVRVMVPPNGARLADAFRRTYETAGVSQADIAKAIGVDQPTVSKWARGDRRPPLDVLPTVERLCDVRRGTILRAAGYVDDTTDLLAAIATDPHLDPDGKDALRLLYRVLSARNAAAAEPV